jgi:hypothetical protein
MPLAAGMAAKRTLTRPNVSIAKSGFDAQTRFLSSIRRSPSRAFEPTGGDNLMDAVSSFSADL